MVGKIVPVWLDVVALVVPFTEEDVPVREENVVVVLLENVVVVDNDPLGPTVAEVLFIIDEVVEDVTELVVMLGCGQKDVGTTTRSTKMQSAGPSASLKTAFSVPSAVTQNSAAKPEKNALFHTIKLPTTEKPLLMEPSVPDKSGAKLTPGDVETIWPLAVSWPALRANWVPSTQAAVR